MKISLKNNFAEKLMRLFQKWPFYILLLPLFFILHGARENFGFILFSDAASLFLVYVSIIVFIYIILYFIYRRPTKAGLLTILLSGIFFFFGAFQDFLKAHIPSLNRYSILFILLFLSVLTTFIVLKKTRNNFKKLSLFLNILLLLFCFYDLSSIFIEALFPKEDKFSIYPFTQNEDFKTCKDCSKPDIYFLLFDEYASSLCLENNFGFNNSALDSFLLNKKFHIQKNSSGNYNFTPFSMASILNMSYIKGIDEKRITIDDYARCNKLISENEVIKLFSFYGYDIINYSIFDIAGNPSPVYQDLLPLKTKLITDRTLWGRIKRDILWNVFTGKFEIKWFTDSIVFFILRSNNKLIDLVKQESSKTAKNPRFIYAHYSMPHHPFYFDENGKIRDKKVIKDDYSRNSYLNNVKYTNTKIQELVNTIQTNTQGKAVIIIMGDHGFRLDSTLPKNVFFENQNAVYLPDKNYKLFYDSITGVNQFRVLTNTLFKQNLPLLKDSTIFLKDK
ncbi:MAG: sulfatase-like hydrolase/transferase [Chitinophagaceae bacterium]